jgi:hypothetical protein
VNIVINCLVHKRRATSGPAVRLSAFQDESVPCGRHCLNTSHIALTLSGYNLTNPVHFIHLVNQRTRLLGVTPSV